MISLIYKLFTNMYNNNKRFLRFFPYDNQVFNLKVKRKQTQRSAYWLIVLARWKSFRDSCISSMTSRADDAIVMTVVVSLLRDQTRNIFANIALIRTKGDAAISVSCRDERRRKITRYLLALWCIIKSRKKKS